MKNYHIKILILFLAIFSIGIATYATTQKPILRDEKPVQIQLEGFNQFTKTNPEITLSLRNSDVQQVLRMFADKAGLNIVFHNSVPTNKKISLDLVNVPLNEAFKMVLQVSDLTCNINDKTMIITDAKEAKNLAYSKTTMTVLPVKNLDASIIANFLNKNIYSQNITGLSNGNIVTTNPINNELLIFGTKNDVIMAMKILDQFDKKPTSTTFTLNYTTPKEMSDLICNIFIPSTFGINSNKTKTPNEKAINNSNNINLGEGIVSCNVNSITSNENFSSFPTQALTVSYSPQLGTVNVVGGNDSQINSLKEFVKEHDKKQLMAYLELAITEKKNNSKNNVIATSRILLTNGQTSIINISDDYIKKFSKTKYNKNYIIGQDKELNIIITPQINANGYVTFNINQDFSTQNQQIGRKKNPKATLLSKNNLNLKNIRVKDGETITLGCFTLENQKNKRKTKSEILIVATPKIINDK